MESEHVKKLRELQLKEKELKIKEREAKLEELKKEKELRLRERELKLEEIEQKLHREKEKKAEETKKKEQKLQKEKEKQEQKLQKEKEKQEQKLQKENKHENKENLNANLGRINLKLRHILNSPIESAKFFSENFSNSDKSSDLIGILNYNVNNNEFFEFLFKNVNLSALLKSSYKDLFSELINLGKGEPKIKLLDYLNKNPNDFDVIYEPPVGVKFIADNKEFLKTLLVRFLANEREKAKPYRGIPSEYQKKIIEINKKEEKFFLLIGEKKIGQKTQIFVQTKPVNVQIPTAKPIPAQQSSKPNEKPVVKSTHIVKKPLVEIEDSDQDSINPEILDLDLDSDFDFDLDLDEISEKVKKSSNQSEHEF